MARRSPLFQRFSRINGANPFSCGCITGVFLFWGLIICLLLIVSVVRTATGGNFNADLNIHNHQTLRIQAARGLPETIHVNAGTSIQGNWATSANILLVFDDALIKPLAILSPKDRTWSDQISISCSQSYGSDKCPSGQEMFLDCNFTIPDLAEPIARTINGHITGTIYWPHDRGDGTFDTQSTIIDVPVQIDLKPISQIGLFTWNNATFGYGALIALLLSLIIAFVAASRYRSFLKGK